MHELVDPVLASLARRDPAMNFSSMGDLWGAENVGGITVGAGRGSILGSGISDWAEEGRFNLGGGPLIGEGAAELGLLESSGAERGRIITAVKVPSTRIRLTAMPEHGVQTKPSVDRYCGIQAEQKAP